MEAHISTMSEGPWRSGCDDDIEQAEETRQSAPRNEELAGHSSLVQACGGRTMLSLEYSQSATPVGVRVSGMEGRQELRLFTLGSLPTPAR